jgi:hypothetical protein
MPLPKKTIRVLPNPWGFIHHELGPQGSCHEDTGGRGSTPRYIGAELDTDRIKRLAEYEKEPTETRLDPWLIVFRFPALNAELLAPAVGFEKGIELPKTPYYLDRLRDGDLIPADPRSGEHGARFANLAEAKAAGVAAFEAHYGKGSFAEVMAELTSPPETAPAAPAAPEVEPSAPAAPAPEQAPSPTHSEPEAETSAATPNARRARSSSNGGQS